MAFSPDGTKCVSGSFDNTLKVWDVFSRAFEEMLIDSVLRAGRFDQAKALLADRLQRRPRNAWGWRHYAQVLDRLGDGDGAATARATAERLIAA